MKIRLTNGNNEPRNVMTHNHSRILINPGQTLTIDIGSEDRLINYYTALMRYGFKVDQIEGNQYDTTSFENAKTYVTKTPKSTSNGSINTNFNGNSEIIDSKLGEPIDDYTAKLPEDYPEIDDPVLDRIEAEEKKLNEERSFITNSYEELDKLNEDQLKKMLSEQFNENTRLRSKSRIINHIIELVQDTGDDVVELVDKYIG